VPTLQPTPVPTLTPTPVPTPVPTPLPTPFPTPVPTLQPTPVPSLQPTPVPTLLPSATPVPTPEPSATPSPPPTLSLAPSPQPSVVPTVFECPRTAGGALDPSPYLVQASVRIRAASGVAFPLGQVESSSTSGVVASLNGSFARPFGFLAAGGAPGAAFAFQASLGGGRVALASDAAPAGYTIKETASRVEVVVKTSTVYFDSTSVEVRRKPRVLCSEGAVTRRISSFSYFL